MIRAVIDVSVLVRAIIKPDGTVGPILSLLREGAYVYLYSEAMLDETVDVLQRPRIRDKYQVTDDDIETVLAIVMLRGEPVSPTRAITICRDPKDDKVLELAVGGRADVIVSGDEDLLVLNPFEGVPIVGPTVFITMVDR